jgi:kynurenine formamidase
MKTTKTLAIAAILYFAIFLFARRQVPSHAEQLFRGVSDLSSAIATSKQELNTTTIFAPEGSTVEQITPDRFITPLVVISGTEKNPITFNNIAVYERQHGTIPAGAVVAFQTGAPDAPEVLEFLVQARHIYGVSLPTNASSTIVKAAEHNGLYVLTNLQEVSTLPRADSILIVAPLKTAGATSAPARVFALLR